MSNGAPAPLPPTQPPSTIEYGGDEISALVLDPGSAWTRAGFAGEDTPKTVIPTHYGHLPGATADSPATHLFGDTSLHALRPHVEIRSPMADGVVADWDVIPGLWRHALTSRLTSALDEHPLLITEPAWNPAKNRERTAEVAFEDFGVPAFYLAKSAVCAAFASGKGSALMVEAGASGVSITPVHDGFVLRKGVQRSPLGGDFLSAQIRRFLQGANAQLSAHYQVLAKSQVDVGKPAEAKMRVFAEGEAPTESWRAFQEERVLQDFKETVCQVSATPFNPAAAAPQGDPSVRPFEFPDGYNLVFNTPDRFRITEPLFNPALALTENTPETAPLAQLFQQSIKEVDVEIRQHILNNVVVTGGTSLLYGFNDRLNFELGQAFSAPRVRLTSPGNVSERKFAGWLGGSILASLGSFHQLWVSRKEYEEHGPNIVEKRCK